MTVIIHQDDAHNGRVFKHLCLCVFICVFCYAHTRLFVQALKSPDETVVYEAALCLDVLCGLEEALK